jgi:hypothetical protein
MKYTLLQMTQDILSGMSSDEVNSVSDTAESLQVANIIKQKYFDIINRVPLPEHEQLVQLDPSLDSAQPVLMYIPAGVADLKWLKYYDTNVLDGNNGVDQTHDTNTDIVASDGDIEDTIPGYQYVTILSTRQFIDMVNKFNPAEDGVESFTLADTNNNFPGNYTFYYRTDRQPRFCTIISNYYVVFDSFDSTQDSTLQGSKTMGWGRIIPSWSNSDSFIPNLAEEQFQLLFNEAKALAFFELKQQPHQLALQETKRGWSNVQKNKAVANRPTYFDELPSYGRFGRGGWGVSSYFKQRGFDRP